jgi:arginase
MPVEPRLGWGIVGVPSSAGSHNAGQDKAPGAWRAVGLLDRLRAEGLEVRDFGDLPARRHRPVERTGGVRDLERVVDVARATADLVAHVHASGWVPLVLGGDCTITLGVLAGLTRTRDVGLLYFDGDADLNTPETSGSGVLDTMGVTHLLGGGMPALSHLGPRYPLLRPHQLELVGFDPGELDVGQWSTLASRALHAHPAPLVRADPAAAAAAAISRLEAAVDAVLVHFDVDVLDTGLFPLANFPHFAGLTLEQTSICLTRFCASTKLAGLVITEVNPDHDPDRVLLPALRDVLCPALRGSAAADLL